MNGLILAILAAILFGVSPLFMKSGVKKTPSYLGAAVWTTVMLLFAIVQVGRTGTVTKLSSLGNIRLLLLVLSGIALGGAIIFLSHALKDGEVIKVVSILAPEYFVLYILARIIGKTLPSIPRIVVLVVLVVAVVMMATKSKGKGGRAWCRNSLISMGLLVLSKYIYRYHVGGLATSFRYLCLFLIAAIVVWIAALSTRSLSSIRKLSFVDGILIIGSVILLAAANLCASQAVVNGSVVSTQLLLFASMISTVLFACAFLKERMTAQYLVGLCIFQAGCFLWLGYIPVLSEML